jgi:hypothetical protein
MYLGVHDLHHESFLGLALTGTKPITLDPTFGNFTLLEPISH